MNRKLRRIILRIAVMTGLLLILPLGLIYVIVSCPLFAKVETKPVMQCDPELLKKHVEFISQECYPRSYLHTANLRKCADYIEDAFAATGGRVSRQEYRAGRFTYENICLVFPGSSRERVVVGAHYDAYDGSYGADDNASAVAGLVELAGMLDGKELNKTVELVAYCTEEPPYFATENMGSFVHARSLKQQQVEVSAMIALEMIGYFSDAPGSQKYPMPFMKLFYPSRGNFVGVVSHLGGRSVLSKMKKLMKAGSDIPVYAAALPRFIPGVDFSDHRNYWEHGYPAVMITDTAFLRNPMYHQKNDTADLLDYTKMAQVVESTCHAITHLAKPPTPKRYGAANDSPHSRGTRESRRAGQ